VGYLLTDKLGDFVIRKAQRFKYDIEFLVENDTLPDHHNILTFKAYLTRPKYKIIDIPYKKLRHICFNLNVAIDCFLSASFRMIGYELYKFNVMSVRSDTVSAGRKLASNKILKIKLLF